MTADPTENGPLELIKRTAPDTQTVPLVCVHGAWCWEDFLDYFAHIQDESYLGFLDMLLFRFAAPEQVKPPVIVMGALEDTIFTPAEIEKTADAYGREAVMFADMAHDMMLEDGWKDVADRILTELTFD